MALGSWLLLLVVACGAATVSAQYVDRTLEVQSFINTTTMEVDVNNPARMKNFMDKFMSKVYKKELLNDPAWRKLALNLLNPLLHDADFCLPDKYGKLTQIAAPMLVPNNQSICEFTAPFGAPPKFHLCGRLARIWLRMVFHDCGTYNRKTNTGGCDGSLCWMELPNLILSGPYRDGNVDLFPFRDPELPTGSEAVENTGMAPSCGFFNGARKDFTPTVLKDAYGYNITLADTVVFGGITALWVCGGEPFIAEIHRPDVKVASPTGLLPSPLQSFKGNRKDFHRMGLNREDMVALIGGPHTCGAAKTAITDVSPNKFDNAWAKEAVEAAAYLAKGLKPKNPICNLTRAADFSADVIKDAPEGGQCSMGFVVDLIKAGSYLQDMAKSPSYFTKQFSKSMYKLTNLVPAYAKPKLHDNFDDYYEDDQKTDAERQETVKAWREYHERRMMMATSRKMSM